MRQLLLTKLIFKSRKELKLVELVLFKTNTSGKGNALKIITNKNYNIINVSKKIILCLLKLVC